MTAKPTPAKQKTHSTPTTKRATAKTTAQGDPKAPSAALLEKITQVQAMPARLVDVFSAQAALAKQGIYFAPVRHHSPACAYALKAWITQLRPTHILIEAPAAFESLLSDLLSADTVPPVAIFVQATLKQPAQPANPKSDDDNAADDEHHDDLHSVRSAYFPFCEYSPEWVAMRDGAAMGAEIGFIDLDWASQCQLEHINDTKGSGEHQAQTNLMAERYLAHSQFIQALARACHCRNHDELWSHLFELRDGAALAKASIFFSDVLAWCALARLDYEDEVLLAEGSLHREYAMYDKIAKVLKGEHGNVLVVTGGFHTLALIEQLSSKKVKKYALNKKDIHYSQDAWLIRYSFDRLDALSGYASGMPSPAYYQWWWQSLMAQGLNEQRASAPATTTGEQTALNTDLDDDAQYINALCHHLHARDCYEMTPFIAFKSVMEMAVGLATLRGHHRPAREDLLDALQSALIKGERDDGRHHLWRCVHDYLSGDKLGQVAKGTRTPALVAHVYQHATAFRFKLDDTAQKTRKLDVYRKPMHRQISQFLHLLDFLAVGFASRVSGPDFVLGTGMSLLFEEWRYAWTPNVEAQLIGLSERGDRLEVLALEKLQQMAGTGLAQVPSSADSARLLAMACRLGLKSQLPRMQARLDTHLHEETRLVAAVAAAEQLFYLWHGRTLLGLPEAALIHSLKLAIDQSFYLIDQLYDDHEDARDTCVDTFKQLYHLLRHIEDKLGMTGLMAAFYKRLDGARMRELGLYQLMGASDSIAYLDGRVSAAHWQANITRAFAVGALPDDAVAYLQGMFKLAPEIFVQSDTAISALHQQIASWQDDYFISVLPDLRFMFSQLNPKQSDHIADTVARLTGLSTGDIRQVALTLSETDMLQASRLNQQLKDLLSHDRLTAWLDGGV